MRFSNRSHKSFCSLRWWDGLAFKWFGMPWKFSLVTDPCFARWPYEVIVDVNFPEIGISWPISSLAISILNTCRIELIVMKRVLSAIYLPGQILIRELSMRGMSLRKPMITNLRPNPKAGREPFLSASRNLSGRNSSVADPNSFSSRSITLHWNFQQCNLVL